MNTESTHHLDIDDLLGVVDGEILEEELGAHLAACARCNSEAERWRVVAAGVRHVAATVPLPSRPLIDLAPLDWLNSGSRSGPEPAVPLGSRSRRRTLVVSAAAALVLIGGGSFGLSLALRGGGGGRARPPIDARATTLAAGLTAVDGCPALAGTSGTLQELNGSNLVIRTSSGQLVNVTTSSSTNIGRETNGSLADISDGSQVIVNGTDSGGTIAAATVGVGVIGAVKLAPTHLGLSKGGLVAGTVDDADTEGFTVVEPNGTHVAVTTGSSTTVVSLSTAEVDQLQVGEFMIALGTPAGGTLAANRIEQLPPSTSSLPQPPAPFGMATSKQITPATSGGCSVSAALLLPS